ncbi:MAG: RNA-directed DNA polymerase [Bacteroidetes bacterium]|nr:MAG: RNA-directed DNA polymerase [Bacteroidota bacterium]
MKRLNNLTELAADPANLRLAFVKARKGKQGSGAVQGYARHLQANLLILRNQIRSGKVRVGNYRFFTIRDPKERLICAPAFSEQVLHHALMNVCHDRFESFQIFDSYASRKGKGVHAALDRAQHYVRKYNWFLKLDVRKYFASISHEVLLGQLERLFKDQRLLDIFHSIVQSWEATPGRGLPIGALSSQYFANHYLAVLDHYVREMLCPGGYLRYMDDMVLFGKDKNLLKEMLGRIESFTAERLQLQLKPPQLLRCRHGLSFLGYRLFAQQRRLTRRSKRRFLRKMQLLQVQWQTGAWDEETCRRHALPLLAFTRHADTLGLRRQLLENI